MSLGDSFTFTNPLLRDGRRVGHGLQPLRRHPAGSDQPQRRPVRCGPGAPRWQRCSGRPRPRAASRDGVDGGRDRRHRGLRRGAGDGGVRGRHDHGDAAPLIRCTPRPLARRGRTRRRSRHPCPARPSPAASRSPRRSCVAAVAISALGGRGAADAPARRAAARERARPGVRRVPDRPAAAGQPDRVGARRRRARVRTCGSWRSTRGTSVRPGGPAERAVAQVVGVRERSGPGSWSWSRSSPSSCCSPTAGSRRRAGGARRPSPSARGARCGCRSRSPTSRSWTAPRTGRATRSGCSRPDGPMLKVFWIAYAMFALSLLAAPVADLVAAGAPPAGSSGSSCAGSPTRGC